MEKVQDGKGGTSLEAADGAADTLVPPLPILSIIGGYGGGLLLRPSGRGFGQRGIRKPRRVFLILPG
jgi:hypothetical protein